MQDKKDVSMGCNSDYMNPNASEANSSKTARNLAYALEKMGISIPDSVSSAAQSYYGNASLLNEFTDLRGMPRTFRSGMNSTSSVAA